MDSPWERANWRLVFGGIADSCMKMFDADGWRFRYGHPAMGTAAICPSRQDQAPATAKEAQWLADCVAFDHDAPVGIAPMVRGVQPFAVPRDPIELPSLPAHVLGELTTLRYWENIEATLDVAADARFGDSYVVRYDRSGDAPRTDFTQRFQGFEDRVSMYAMAARQPDLLVQYLLLYRILEAADGGNGKAYVDAKLEAAMQREWGRLELVHSLDLSLTDVFRLWQHQADIELWRIRENEFAGVSDYLYGIRNALAHGKLGPLYGHHGGEVSAVGRALPLVKLLARHAVEPLDA